MHNSFGKREAAPVSSEPSIGGMQALGTVALNANQQRTIADIRTYILIRFGICKRSRLKTEAKGLYQYQCR